MISVICIVMSIIIDYTIIIIIVNIITTVTIIITAIIIIIISSMSRAAPSAICSTPLGTRSGNICGPEKSNAAADDLWSSAASGLPP